MTSITQVTKRKRAWQYCKFYFQLVELGLKPRLALLYGVLEYHSRGCGDCRLTHEMLAREIGLRGKHSRAWVNQLLKQLRDLQLVKWHREGPNPNHYHVFWLDAKWIRTRRELLRRGV